MGVLFVSAHAALGSQLTPLPALFPSCGGITRKARVFEVKGYSLAALARPPLSIALRQEHWHSADRPARLGLVGARGAWPHLSDRFVNGQRTKLPGRFALQVVFMILPLRHVTLERATYFWSRSHPRRARGGAESERSYGIFYADPFFGSLERVPFEPA